ncbi:MAG: hypothetical protein Q8O67_00465 [Deltaproteobacteria bacterium]|nr:hypothetical protein [Deltaproteobacteria bacterium]
MTKPLGPKGTDPSLTMGKVLQLRQQLVEKVEAPKTEPTTTTTTTKTDSSTFEGSSGTAQTMAAPVDGAGASQVLARLKARGFEGKKLTKTAETSRVADTAEGKVLSGQLTIESRSGLQKLVDVVRVGELTVHEGVFKNADFLALKSLKIVERRLTFEGLSAS